MEWTDAKIHCLISMFERKPCLYNYKSEDYHNHEIGGHLLLRRGKENKTRIVDISSLATIIDNYH